MTQFSILSGIYVDEAADFRSSYPINLTPVPKDNGISKGYLRPSDGVIQQAVGAATDRGGINWRGVCYRVLGTKLVSIDINGVITTLGTIAGTNPVRFDYSFDRLAIASGGLLYYLVGTTVSQMSDPDILKVVDMLWVDGYFMTTDGEFLVVTELNDPNAVEPLKYGSSEADPDPIKALLKFTGEVYALNRHTIELFDNTGGAGFPFTRIESAQINKGILGTRCACVVSDIGIAFLGSGRNEAPAVYMGTNSLATKISTREIDQILLEYTEQQLSESFMEVRVDKSHLHVIIHLPDRAIVYDVSGSQAVAQPLWFILTSALAEFSTYRAKYLVWCYDKWLCSDPTSTKLGYMTDTVSSQYGDIIRWEFGTSIVYNESNGAVFHELELVSLPGRVEFGKDPYISTSYSVDGETWSQQKFVSAGKQGARNKRIVWFQQGMMNNWRIQRFMGTSDAHISVARLEAQLEPLAY